MKSIPKPAGSQSEGAKTDKSNSRQRLWVKCDNGQIIKMSLIRSDFKPSFKCGQDRDKTQSGLTGKSKTTSVMESLAANMRFWTELLDVNWHFK